MPLENLDDLNAAWNFFLMDKNDKGRLTQNGAWRRDNPGEWDKLKLYYEEKGPRPTLASITGKQMVEVVDAIIEARKGGVIEPPPVDLPPPTPSTYPQPPQGTLRQESGDHFYRDGNGLLTEKLHITSAPGYGIANMRWPISTPSTGVWEVRDCKVENVAASPPKSMDGRGEAGLWVGERAKIERMEIKNCAWMGMWTGASVKGSRFYHLNIHSQTSIPLYIEHVTQDCEWWWCNIGGPVGVAQSGSSINSEWWYEDGVYGPTLPYGGKAGSFNNKFIECKIYCPLPPDPNHWTAYFHKGAFLDAGTFGYEFIRCEFYGPGDCVGFPNNRVDMSKQNKLIDCVFKNGGLKTPAYHDNAIG